MRLLLDTHIFLWFINNDSNLNQNMKNLIEDAGTEAFLSIASVWEMAIKINIGKLRFPETFDHFIETQLKTNEFELLGINLKHVSVISSLPLHHRDPFDRLLIAQSMVEQMPLISADVAFDAYSAFTRLW